MPPVYRDTNAGLILTAQFGSTLCISYSNVERLSFQSPLQMLHPQWWTKEILENFSGCERARKEFIYL